MAVNVDVNGYEKGKRLFIKLCSECHSTTAASIGKAGPPLNGLINRRCGTITDFAYSPSMSRRAFVWSRSMLNNFLKSPHQAVPGNKMVFEGIEDERKRNYLIAYFEREGMNSVGRVPTGTSPLKRKSELNPPLKMKIPRSIFEDTNAATSSKNPRKIGRLEVDGQDVKDFEKGEKTTKAYTKKLIEEYYMLTAQIAALDEKRATTLKKLFEQINENTEDT